MSRRSPLNLATAPFVNRRPALRLAILLWIIAGGLTALNLSLYLGRLPGASLTPEQQRQVRAEIADLRQEVRELRSELSTYDVTELNTTAAFVNRRIAARTFSWSDLFDQLSEAMPYHVRLVSLEPELRGGDRSRERDKPLESVLLQIRGTARDSAAILEFVDSLYEHERFRHANLVAERTNESGEVDFALTVTYRREARHAAESSRAVERVAPSSDDETEEAGSSDQVAEDGAEAAP